MPDAFGNALGQALASNGAGQQSEKALQAHEDARDQALWNSVGGGSSSGSQVSGVLPQSYLDGRVFADKGNVPGDAGGLRVYGMVPQRVENSIQNVVFDGGYDSDANAEAQLVHNSNDELITNEDRERDRYFRKESAKVRAQDVENDNIAAQQQASRLARAAQEATARSQIGLNNTSSLVELNSRTSMSAATLVTTEAVTNNYEGMFSLTMTDQERNRPDAVTQWKDGILSSIVEQGARSRYTLPYATAYGIVDTFVPGSSGEAILMGGGAIAGALSKTGRVLDNVEKVTNTIATESGVWKLDPFLRGQRIEQGLGHNLPGNFPVIDRFENGLATSIKSLDLDAATYQSTATLNRTLTGYVDKAAGFQGQTWAGVRIRSQDISGRALDLAIPHSGSAAQQAIISQTVKYGASRGVTVNVITYP